MYITKLPAVETEIPRDAFDPPRDPQEPLRDALGSPKYPPGTLRANSHDQCFGVFQSALKKNQQRCTGGAGEGDPRLGRI